MLDVMPPYDPRHWYWIVNGDEGRTWSSAAQRYVPIDDAAFQAWRDAGGVPTSIDSEASLIAVLRAADVPPYHLVPARLIVDRLQAAGKLTAARLALDAADLYTRERWNNRERIYADDPTARALLAAIGVDPDAILAPE